MSKFNIGDVVYIVETNGHSGNPWVDDYNKSYISKILITNDGVYYEHTDDFDNIRFIHESRVHASLDEAKKYLELVYQMSKVDTTFFSKWKKENNKYELKDLHSTANEFSHAKPPLF